MQQLLKTTTRMRKIVFPIIAFLVATSCSKDKNNSGNVINPADGTAVAASITVLNSEKQTGTMPPSANNSNAPVLQASFSEPVKTIAGKYIVIEPFLQSGTAAGYYVSVKGANGFFKINSAAASQFIVIQLPQNIQPGSFKILYSVFDANNNASNTIEAIIQIVEPGSKGSENFAGTWKLTGELEPYLAWDYNLYGRKDGDFNVFNCINNKIGSLHVSQDTYPTVHAPMWQYDLKKAEWVLAQAGTMQQYYQKDAYILDYNLSTCSNVVHKPDPASNNNSTRNNGWMYDAATKRLSFFYNYESPDTTAGYSYSEEFEVMEISATKMIIRSTINDKYAWEYTRQ